MDVLEVVEDQQDRVSAERIAQALDQWAAPWLYDPQRLCDSRADNFGGGQRGQRDKDDLVNTFIPCTSRDGEA
jgi:hypothetical protein